ncbi:MAG: DUF896 domain-containing protein [Anaerovoracaceae bacterium]
MISEEKIARINELAKFAKERELSPEELIERDALRKEYIKAMRANVKQHLENIKFVEDLPEDERKKYENNKN